jgi:hypothetical protein
MLLSSLSMRRVILMNVSETLICNAVPVIPEGVKRVTPLYVTVFVTI